MNIKNEINQLQKQMLDRLNVRTGSTLYIIIQEISRQAYTKQSFVVSQKNSTLASKCNVTPSTISRNLKKLKEKCADLITIEQNRHSDEKFAALVFTFNPESTSEPSSEVKNEMTNGMSNGLSNGQEQKLVNTDNECIEVSQLTSNISNQTIKTLNTNTVNSKVDKENTIHELYAEFSKQGIGKSLFQRVLAEVEHNRGIRNFGAYMRGTLQNVVYRKGLKDGSIVSKMVANMENSNVLYDWLNS